VTEMSAKAIRAAREAKAKRLGSSGDPRAKVDASTWTPPEQLNAEAKTGMRPVSRRQYKAGGKVGMEASGSCGPMRADKKPRKSGGSVAEKINRNVKEANAEIAKPHTGGMKRGGRTHRADGGNLPLPPKAPPAPPRKAPPRPTYEEDVTPPRGMRGYVPEMRKSGGKVSAMEWERSKTDLKQDRKLAKKHGMSMKAWEKSSLDAKHDKQQSPKGLKKGGEIGNYAGGTRPTGGRIARKDGGSAKGKGKTNIIISINPGQGAANAMPPGNLPPGGGARPGAGAMPVPVPMPPPAAAAPPPMPMPPPGPMAGPGPGPDMPIPRKAGGRTYRSYKDMDAGSGSGLGRLEKTEIQAHKR